MEPIEKLTLEFSGGKGPFREEKTIRSMQCRAGKSPNFFPGTYGSCGSVLSFTFGFCWANFLAFSALAFSEACLIFSACLSRTRSSYPFFMRKVYIEYARDAKLDVARFTELCD